jgi:hypothetical protein
MNGYRVIWSWLFQGSALLDLELRAIGTEGKLQRAGLGGRGDSGQRLQQQPIRRAAGLGRGAMERMKFI